MDQEPVNIFRRQNIDTFNKDSGYVVALSHLVKPRELQKIHSVVCYTLHVHPGNILRPHYT